MKFQAFMRVATTLTLVYTGSSVLAENVCAQAIDFSQIDAFESLGRRYEVRHHRRQLSMMINGTHSPPFFSLPFLNDL